MGDVRPEEFTMLILFKEWHTLHKSTSLSVISQEPLQEEKDVGEEGDLESYLLPTDDQHLIRVNDLTTSQQQELQQIYRSSLMLQERG